MLFGISFTAKPGKEAELETTVQGDALLRQAAEAMGATFDCLLAQGNRYTLVYEFPRAEPEEARARVLDAFNAPGVQDALRHMAPRLGDPFDPEDATSFAAWVQRHKVRIVAEVHREGAR
jgi:hypothetical protein